MSIRTSTNTYGNTFTVTFDCSPWDIGQHKAAGTRRLDIWEGVKTAATEYRIDGGPWKSQGAAHRFDVSVNKNGVKIEARAKIEVWTMGKPGNDFPSFQFGKWDSKNKIMQYKDNNEKWTQNMAEKPTILRSDWKTITGLDSSWSLGHLDWFPPDSDIYSGNWTYRHTLALRPGYRFPTLWLNGAEYRNGNHATNSAATNYGWKSVQGNYPQEYRKSQYFVFFKYYTASVTSSGISTETGTPEISANWSIGDSGSVSVKYKDPYNIKGKLELRAVCNGKTHYITTFDSSPDYYNDNVRSYSINFNEVFGTSYRGHDVYYYVQGRNSYGSTSITVSAGPQRYNKHPNTPNGAWISISGKTLNMGWNGTWDPDGDAVSYCIYPYVYQNNNWVRINGSGKDYGHWTTSTSYSLNVNGYAEGTQFMFQVWSYDGRLYSTGYSQSGTDYIRYTVKQAAVLYPKSQICSKRPRIVLSVYATPDNDPVTTHICWNGVWYNSAEHSQYFSVSGDSTRYNHQQVFRPPSDIWGSSLLMQYKTSNSTSTSPTSNKTITRKDVMYDKPAQGELILDDHYNILLSYIATHASAYDVGGYTTYAPSAGTIISASHFNQLLDSINNVNNNINNYGYRINYNPVKLQQNQFISISNIDSILNDIQSI